MILYEAKFVNHNKMDIIKTNMKVKKGIYKHFKGDFYQVIGMARHSESLEEMILYRHVNEDPNKDFFGEMWVRPATMFLETVERDGKKVPRFEFIKSK